MNDFVIKFVTTVSIMNINKLQSIIEFARQYDLQNLFNIMTENRTLLHYEDLFCTDAPFPNLPEREDEWLMLVHQSWCETDKCGYRNFEVPDGWEKYKYTNDPHHQKIIDHVKKWIDGKTI